VRRDPLNACASSATYADGGKSKPVKQGGVENWGDT
jgi:hypothetical protein